LQQPYQAKYDDGKMEQESKTHVTGLDTDEHGLRLITKRSRRLKIYPPMDARRPVRGTSALRGSRREWCSAMPTRPA